MIDEFSAMQDPALSHELMIGVLSTAPDSIVIIDQSGAMLAVNPSFSRLFGYDEAEVRGRNVALLMPSPDREMHDDYIARYIATNQPRIIGRGREVTCQRKDGSLFPADLSVGAAVVGGVHYFTGIIRDASPRKALEEKMRNQSRIEALGELTSGIAHDFNNLLSIVGGNLEMLASAIDDPGLAGALDDARDACRSGAGLIRQLLAFARQRPLAPRRVDVGDLVLRMEAFLHRSLESGVGFDIKVTSDLWPVRADPGEVEISLLNLVINARDALAGKGHIAIHADNLALAAPTPLGGEAVSPGRYVRITVADDGPGVPPALINRIFEPFFTTKPAGVGTGLGLSRVYGFVTQSGGRIWVENQASGGAAFCILLPVDPGTPGDEDDSADDPYEVLDRKPVGRRILLVEDDPRLRRLVARQLREMGHAVAVAENGDRALAQAGAIDILLSDIVMPGATGGVELADQLRARIPGLRVLLMSGNVPDAAFWRDDSPPYPFIAKPFGRDDLAAALARLD